jgi:CDP-glucose 4,6-dehydratase
MSEGARVPEGFWQDRRVLVTGATGLVGGRLVGQLVSRGADVVTLVRDRVRGCEYVRRNLRDACTEVRGELEDLRLLERILAEYEIHTVFHLAAQTIVGIGVRSPISTFEANIRGTYHLLEAARRNPTVKGVVVASSDKAYGAQENLPYTEDRPLMGRHPYDVSKSCADLLSLACHATYGFPVAVARCANFYGGGDLNWNRIVPGTVRSVLRGQRPLIRSDGSPVRDYLYVEDGAHAYRTLAEQLCLRGDVAGEAFNFGTNAARSVLDVTRTVLDVMGSVLEPEILNEASSEIHSQYLDSTKSREWLGWSPRYTFEDGLRETIDWYRDYLGETRECAVPSL